MPPSTPPAAKASPKSIWSDADRRTAEELSISHFKKLEDEGALGLKHPIIIKAKRIVDPRESTSCLPPNTKVIHFQRHGQGYHNLLANVYRECGKKMSPSDPGSPYVRPEIVDSPLTARGFEECAAWRDEASALRPELVVVSPMQRAVRTAMTTFADHMGGETKWVAHEGCREDLGVFTCNKRRALSSIVADFPFLDFGYVDPAEEDTLWRPDAQETGVEKAERAYRFMAEFIFRRPEREIAVVTHSSYLFSLFNTVLDCGKDKELKSWFFTSEIRSIEVTFSEPRDEKSEL